MSPLPFTLRQLVWMAEAQRERDWETISSLMALMANINSTRRGKTYKAADFNPTVDRNQARRSKVLPYSRENMSMLKSLVTRRTANDGSK